MSDRIITRLNGWQRLWVVLSVIYLVAVVVITGMTIQGYHEDYKTRKAIVLHENMTGNKLTQNPLLSGSKGFHVSPIIIEDRLGPINETVNANIDQIYRNAIIKTSVLAFFIWLLPGMFVYALGVSVSWVIRGFPKA